MTEEGGVWVDRPRIGLSYLTFAGTFVIAGIGICLFQLFLLHWHPLATTLLFAWIVGALVASWRSLASLGRTTYTISNDHLDIEWLSRRHTLPIGRYRMCAVAAFRSARSAHR